MNEMFVVLVVSAIDAVTAGTTSSSSVARESLALETPHDVPTRPKVRKLQPSFGEGSGTALDVRDTGMTAKHAGRRWSAATLEPYGSFQLLDAHESNGGRSLDVPSNGVGAPVTERRRNGGEEERGSAALLETTEQAATVGRPKEPSVGKSKKKDRGGSSRFVDRLLRWAFPPSASRLWPARPQRVPSSKLSKQPDAAAAGAFVRSEKDRSRRKAGLYEIETTQKTKEQIPQTIPALLRSGKDRESAGAGIGKDLESVAQKPDDDFQPKWDAATAEAMLAKDMPAANLWFLALTGVVVVFFMSAPLLKSFYKVDPDVDANPEVADDEQDEVLGPRGRSCWTCVILLSTPLIAALSFFLTFVKAETLNVGLASDPNSRHTTSGGEPVTVSFIQSPGERAFEAGVGCVLSVTVACYVTLFWRYLGSVRIRTGMLSLLAFRGATLSLAVAGVLEVAVVLMLPPAAHKKDGFEVSQEADLRNAVLMLMVGVSEELGKALSIITGTVLMSSVVHVGAQGSDAYACWWRCWRVLLDSPRALMLAGLVAGFGFMTLENMLYLIEVASSPPMDFDDEINAEDTRLILRLVRYATILIRVALNIHPWLAGITGARIARYVFGNPRRSYPKLTLLELSWALTPSVLAHMMYDLLVLTAPGLVALIAPPVWFFASRRVFTNEWEKWGNMEVAASVTDPAADPDVARPTAT